MKKFIIYAILLGAAIALAAVPAQATPRTYSFDVTATDGPLAGVSATGTFTFDDSIIPAGGGMVKGTSLLTDLNFTWNGIAYDETTANTGWLTFDAAGILTDPTFGTDCTGTGCTVHGGTNEWYFTDFSFDYAVLGVDGSYHTHDLSFERVDVPEPATLLLLAAGLLGLRVTRRRFKY